MKKHFHIVVLSVLIFSCSTEKNKFINRSFHNTTARFNGYFNANELIKESLIDFHATNKDDYSKLLPVFIIPTDETAKSLYPQMDKAITKTSNVISKHSMPNPAKHANKKEEWCKWIDNNWLVMGKAYYYKREFDEAKTRFEYVYKNYQGLPIKWEGILWEAKTYLEMKDYSNAYFYLEKLQEKMESQTDKAKIASKKKEEAKRKKSKSKTKITVDPDLDASLYDEILMTRADFYLRSKDFTKAEEVLKKAIKECRDKKQRARLHFILGQLFQERGDRSRANMEFATVDKLNPEYEMEFYSRIFRALNYESGNSSALKRLLVKMSKDDKNKDYLDQIYYALSEIALKENDEKLAVNYLQKSVRVSTKNNRQKGLSYKKLGDIKYSHKRFIDAKAYYDSTMLNLPTDYDQYAAVKEKSESLKDLVVHLIVIQREDSLMRIANMEPKDREKFLYKLLADQDAEADRKKQIEENKNNASPDNSVQNNTSTAWYFYNPNMLSKGNVDFKKTYGSRKLEDDWRRSDKTVVDENGDAANEKPDETPVKKDDPVARMQALEKKLPLSKKEQNESNKLLDAALYKAGTIYKDRLNEEKLCIDCFDRITTQIPGYENELPAHFQLYMVYFDKTPDKSKQHADWILEKYPDSEYAKIIRNPNFKKEESLTKEKEEQQYNNIYELFSKRQYENTLTACNDVIGKDPKNNFLPKYYFLRALSYGELKNYEAFENALSETSTKYPKDEIGTAATELLNMYRSYHSRDNALSGASSFLYDANTEHFFVCVFKPDMGSVNDAKAKVSNFNSVNFSLAELKITNIFINTDDQIIMVKKFENKDKAMNYYNAFKGTDMLKGLSDKSDYFIITNRNYSAFYVEKNIEAYLKFFRENYLK